LVPSYNAEHYIAEGIIILNNTTENKKDIPNQKHFKGKFVSVFKEIWRKCSYRNRNLENR